MDTQAMQKTIPSTGQGERLRQTAGGVTTNYTVDLNAGLSQVLADGSYTYLYGNSRLAQSGASGAEYFLTDALGSVRQVVDAAGAVILSKDYRPYGEVLSSQGQVSTSYGFAGEFTSSLTGQSYLRARWYAPSQGRFISRDTWEGDYNRPNSQNRWNYAYSNPLKYLDPSGQKPWCPPGDKTSDCNDWGKLSLLCGEECLENVTKPLSTWAEIYTLSEPEGALLARLLLSELGYRLVSNGNWQTEGFGVLWTLENRISWGDPSKGHKTAFRDCRDYYSCALAPGQYYGLQQPRARDPLYSKYQDPEHMQRNYFRDVNYVPIAVDRAAYLAGLFLSGLVPDPTNVDGKGGAHFFSHYPPPNTHFSRMAEEYCDSEYLSSYREYILDLEYIEQTPPPY